MGQAQSSSTNSYLESGLASFPDPQLVPSVKMYYDDRFSDLIIIQRLYDLKELELLDKKTQIESRMAKLPASIFPAREVSLIQAQGNPPTPASIVNPSETYAVRFISGAMNLNDFVVSEKLKGQRHMPPEDLKFLTAFLLDMGSSLQNLSEYHDTLNMSLIFPTKNGLKVQNPFASKTYLKESTAVRNPNSDLFRFHLDEPHSWRLKDPRSHQESRRSQPSEVHLKSQE